jgi:hypothetical protein
MNTKVKFYLDFESILLHIKFLINLNKKVCLLGQMHQNKLNYCLQDEKTV